MTSSSNGVEHGYEAWSVDGRRIWITVEEEEVVFTAPETETDGEFSLSLNTGHVEQLVNGLLGAVGEQTAGQIVNGWLNRREKR